MGSVNRGCRDIWGVIGPLLNGEDVIPRHATQERSCSCGLLKLVLVRPEQGRRLDEPALLKGREVFRWRFGGLFRLARWSFAAASTLTAFSSQSRDKLIWVDGLDAVAAQDRGLESHPGLKNYSGKKEKHVGRAF